MIQQLHLTLRAFQTKIEHNSVDESTARLPESLIKTLINTNNKKNINYRDLDLRLLVVRSRLREKLRDLFLSRSLLSRPRSLKSSLLSRLLPRSRSLL